MSEAAEAVCRVRMRAQVRAGERQRPMEKARPERKEESWATVAPCQPNTTMYQEAECTQCFQPLQRVGRISGHRLNNPGRQGPGVN